MLRASTRRKAYDTHLLNEYVSKVEAFRQKNTSLAKPVWAHQADFSKVGDVQPSYPAGASSVAHVRTGSLAQRDSVDRSLRALVSGSIRGPRLRTGGHEFARQSVAEEAAAVTVDGKTQRLVTSAQADRVMKPRSGLQPRRRSGQPQGLGQVPRPAVQAGFPRPLPNAPRSLQRCGQGSRRGATPRRTPEGQQVRPRPPRVRQGVQGPD